MADDGEDAELLEVKELGRIERRMGRSHAQRMLVAAAIVMIIGICIILIASRHA